MSENETNRSREEKRILREMERHRGTEYVKQNEELILAQTRKMGDLSDRDPE